MPSSRRHGRTNALLLALTCVLAPILLLVVTFGDANDHPPALEAAVRPASCLFTCVLPDADPVAPIADDAVAPLGLAALLPLRI